MRWQTEKSGAQVLHTGLRMGAALNEREGALEQGDEPPGGEVTKPNVPQGKPDQPWGWVRQPGGDRWQIIIQGVAIIVSAVVILAALWFLRRPIALLIFGVVIAQALEPIVGWLERRMSRVLAVLLVYLVLLLVIAGILWITVPAFVQQVQAVSTRAPELTARLQAWMARRNLSLGQDLLGRLTPQLGSTVGVDLLRLPLRAVETAFDMVVVLFVSIYWLIQTPSMLRFALSLVADGEQARLGEILHGMGRAIGGYLRGTAINGAIIGVATYIALSLIHVDYPLVLGLTAGVLEFVPVLGATVSAILIVAVAFSRSISLGLLALGIELVLHQTEGHILVPQIMHRQTNISPLLAVLAVLAGATIGGVIGAFISIPIVAASQIIVAEIVAPAVRRRTGARPIEQEPDRELEEKATGEG